MFVENWNHGYSSLKVPFGKENPNPKSFLLTKSYIKIEALFSSQKIL
jgi:hypothetical protein